MNTLIRASFHPPFMPLAICPLFLPYYYKYKIFYSRINKEKSGHLANNSILENSKTRKPLYINGFGVFALLILLATFVFKSGQLARKSGQLDS